MDRAESSLSGTSGSQNVGSFMSKLPSGASEGGASASPSPGSPVAALDSRSFSRKPGDSTFSCSLEYTSSVPSEVASLARRYAAAGALSRKSRLLNLFTVRCRLMSSSQEPPPSSSSPRMSSAPRAKSSSSTSSAVPATSRATRSPTTSGSLAISLISPPQTRAMCAPVCRDLGGAPLCVREGPLSPSRPGSLLMNRTDRGARENARLRAVSGAADTPVSQ